MGTDGKIAAQILEMSAAGYAGLVTAALLERDPTLSERYGDKTVETWREQIRQWLLDLAAAVEADAPALFVSRMDWARLGFQARKAPLEDLQTALVALRDTLRERMPQDSAVRVVQIVDRALASEPDAAAAERSGLDPHQPAGRLALSYLKTVLEGDPRAAQEQVLQAVSDGLQVRDAYLQVLLPALREAGRLWHSAELAIADEHLLTTTSLRLMSRLFERARQVAPNGKTVILACVAGNAHATPVHATSDLFEMAGWRAVNLGPDVPDDDLAASVDHFAADLVVLAVTLTSQLKQARSAIDSLRKSAGDRVKILVGGTAFQELPERWREIGADGYAATMDQAEPLGDRLTRPVA